jgi:hypothetical protein
MMLTLTNQSTPGVPGAQLKNSKQPLTRDDSHATLLALLDEGLGCWPEYRAQLSSHLPMALDALQQLGASSARLREFNAHYGARLQPMPTTPSAAERPQQFGRIDEVFATGLHPYLKNFLKRVNELGNGISEEFLR